MKRMLKVLLIAVLLAGPRPVKVPRALAAVTATNADIAGYYAAAVDCYDTEDNTIDKALLLDGTVAGKFDGPNASAGNYLVFHSTKSMELFSAADFAARFRTTASAGVTHVTANTDQTLADNTPTSITWNTEILDPSGLHSTSVNTDRVTVSEAGLYLVGCQLQWAANGTGARQAILGHNGATAFGVGQAGGNASTGETTMSVSIYSAAATDYFTCTGYQTSTGKLDVVKANGASRFWVVKLSK